MAFPVMAFPVRAFPVMAFPVMAFPVMAFPKESQEAFFAGHVAAFQELGGVPKVMVYDNLSTAVKRVLTGSRREEQRDFIAFRSHHLFESSFCRPGEAHEKGLVENVVGDVRRNFLVPLPSVSSFEELNLILQERCQRGLDRELRGRGQTVAQAWEEEREHLFPLPSRGWPCCLTRPAKASLSCLVSFDNNRYSVPAAFAGRQVLVRAYVDRVEIAFADRIVASHQRCYRRGRDVMDPYLAVTLGLAACRQGHRVRFATAASLINELMEAQAQLRLSKLEPWT